MSWDLYLIQTVDGHDFYAGEWNYTHNCNGMIERVLDVFGENVGPEPFWVKLGATGMGRGAWWGLLHGISAADAALVLTRIVGGLCEAPEMFREMNPANGWGDYDSLLKVLSDIRDACLDNPSARVEVSG